MSMKWPWLAVGILTGPEPLAGAEESKQAGWRWQRKSANRHRSFLHASAWGRRLTLERSCQLCKAKRLPEVRAYPRWTQTFQRDAGLSIAGHHDNRHLVQAGYLSTAFDERRAVHHRHVEIRHDDLRRCRGGHGQRLSSVSGFVDTVTLPTQDLAYCDTQSSVVLHQQDMLHLVLVHCGTWTFESSCSWMCNLRASCPPDLCDRPARVGAKWLARQGSGLTLLPGHASPGR